MVNDLTQSHMRLSKDNNNNTKCLVRSTQLSPADTNNKSLSPVTSESSLWNNNRLSTGMKVRLCRVIWTDHATGVPHGLAGKHALSERLLSLSWQTPPPPPQWTDTCYQYTLWSGWHLCPAPPFRLATPTTVGLMDFLPV